MNSQNNQDDSMNFSVIEPNPQPQSAADFSVRSLLGEQQEPQFTKPSSAALNLHKSVENFLVKMKNLRVVNCRSTIKGESDSIQGEGNQFMKALAKMQKELSFQSTLYNVYEDNQNTSTDVVNPNKQKTYSCLKTTKEETIKSTNKSTIKDEVFNLNEYYGPLIIDFKKDNKVNRKSQASKSSRNKSKHLKNDSKSSNNLSSQYSQGSKIVTKRVVKSKSKDELSHLFGRQKSKNQKYHLGVPDFRKSKSKSHTSQLGSKSQSNLKISSQTQNQLSSKIFTQYYGTEVQVSKTKSPEVKNMKKDKLNINKVKSRQKSTSSKGKMTLLSPRNKKSTYTVKRK